MPVIVEPTPNPNAMKFSVGQMIEGPKTYIAGQETDDPLAGELLAIEGVTSVFMTADFVTLSKSADRDWTEIVPRAKEALETHFD